MARVRDEYPLALERALEPSEHLVEPAAEPRDLVVCRRNRQPATWAGGGDRHGALAHPLDGPQRSGGEEIPGQRCKRQRDRTADEKQAAKIAERLDARRERGRDDDHEPLILRRRGHREEPYGLTCHRCVEKRWVQSRLRELCGGEQATDAARRRVDVASATADD